MKMKIMVLAVGFLAAAAGLYLYGSRAQAEGQPAYRQEMSRLICNIKDYGVKHSQRDFFIIANGGAGLMESNGLLPQEEYGRLAEKLDGVMAESVNYGWDMAMDNPMPPEEQEEYHRLLGNAQSQGIVPLVLDYCQGKGETQTAYREDKEHGYLGWVSSRRGLDRLPKELPHNDNDFACEKLSQAKNYLVLLNPEAFPSRESYINSLAASNYDLLIVDAYYGEAVLTPAEVAKLQKKPNGARRLVAAYMSLGEAEDYRPYWQKAWESNPPSWLWTANDDWAGSYRVKYWSKEWQQMLMGSQDSYLDKILAAGFDGAFLDVVDVFYSFEQLANQ